MIGILSERPGLAHQRGNAPADGEIDTLDEGSLNESGKTIWTKIKTRSRKKRSCNRELCFPARSSQRVMVASQSLERRTSTEMSQPSARSIRDRITHVFLIGLEIIQGCVQATGEVLVAPLKFPILDVFVFTPFAITNECVDALIGDPKIITPGIGTGVTFGGDRFLAPTGAFALGVGDDIGVGLQNCQRDPGFAIWTVVR
jgi:hypothetical protein